VCAANKGAASLQYLISEFVQCNILLLQSQTDRCESDIHNDT